MSSFNCSPEFLNACIFLALLINNNIADLLDLGHFSLKINLLSLALPSSNLYILPHDRPISWVVEAGNSDLIQKASRLRRWWTSVPKNHHTWLSWSFFYTKRRGHVIGCANFLVPESFVLKAIHIGRSGYNIPVNLQQDKCYSLFCCFLSLYE